MARMCACLATTTGQARAHLDAMGALGPGHVPAGSRAASWRCSR